MLEGKPYQPQQEQATAPATLQGKILSFESEFDPQKSKQWQYDRIGYLTSSNFSKYFMKRDGKINWGNVIPVLEARKTKENFEKNGWPQDAIIDQFYSKAEIKQFEWGHTFEPVARDLMSEKFDLCGFIKSDKYELLGGSPDGQNETKIAEIKCPYTIGNWGLIKFMGVSKDFKPDYYWQIMANMYVADCKKAMLGVFDPRLVDDTNPEQPRSEYLYEQEFELSAMDEQHIERILQEITRFWRENYGKI